MSDLITRVLLQAKQKGILKRTDIILRYFRMKYRLKLSDKALNKRIKIFQTLESL